MTRMTPKSAAVAAAGGIGVAEQSVDQRVHMEEERPVHERVVGVVLAGGQQPREVGVQALVVVQRPRAEVPEAGQDGGDKDQRVERDLEGDGAFEERGEPPLPVTRLARWGNGGIPAICAGGGPVGQERSWLVVLARQMTDHSSCRRRRLSHAGVPRFHERAPRASGARRQYTMDVLTHGSVPPVLAVARWR